MDDFVLLVENKEVAKEIYIKIEKFLEANLKLKLNPESKYYPYKMGIDFCGYRIFHTHKLVRTRSKKGMLKKIKLWNKLHKEDYLDYQTVKKSIKSWKGHIKHANSYNLETRYLDKIEFKDKLESDRFHMENSDFKKDVLINLTNDEKVSILHDLMKEDSEIISKVYLTAMLKYNKINTNKIASNIFKMLNPLSNDHIIEFLNSGNYDYSNEHDASFDMLNSILEEHFIYLNKFKKLMIKDAYQKYLFGILKGIQKYLFESNSVSVDIFQDDHNVIGSNLFSEWKELADSEEIKKAELTIKSWYDYEF